MATRNPKAPLVIDTLKHEGATRKNIPTAEYQSVMAKDDHTPPPRPPPAHRAGAALCRGPPDCRGKFGGRFPAAPEPRPRPPTSVARQGPAGLERPRRQRPAALHPGEGAPQGADRRPAPGDRAPA